jgi:hypothetical protein
MAVSNLKLDLLPNVVVLNADSKTHDVMHSLHRHALRRRRLDSRASPEKEWTL